MKEKANQHSGFQFEFNSAPPISSVRFEADPAEDTFEQLLESARLGDDEAIGRLLQNHRNYLLLVANREMDQQVRGKLGSSDVVQESLLTAHQHFQRFNGNTKQELLAWLRRIVINDLLHAHRSFKGTRKRQVNREKPLQYNSSFEVPIADQAMTPQTNALAEEESRRLKQALNELSQDYRQVLKLHTWQQKSFEEVGEIMSRSSEAARKLWTRAVLKLQAVINEREARN